jgi:4-hydroxy-tetrahydrodipicolinate reductase
LIKIAVPGVSGRMGAAVAEQVLAADDLGLAVVTARAGNPMVGKKFADSRLDVVSELQGNDFDVLIDFTLPAGVMQHLEYCAQHAIAMVIGATGFSEQQIGLIHAAAKKIPIVLSSNMSLGVNKCYKLLEIAAKMFDDTWDISIIDEHHKHKKDSPSGTAKHMAKIISNSGGRNPKDIEIFSERQGDTVGTHIVTFSNPEEMVMITHVAEDRSIFATGAVVAARWVKGKQPGLYSMQDVI